MLLSLRERESELEVHSVHHSSDERDYHQSRDARLPLRDVSYLIEVSFCFGVLALQVTSILNSRCLGVKDRYSLLWFCHGLGSSLRAWGDTSHA